ncbi:MAG TPA: hypothetical protein DHN29_04720 [Cytophagales bacterium]|jgi:hypothetical protein|nr:hypothetical protein [Cytophagales bacterium]HJL81676.1 DUF3108 domain-containing protein [Gammaproteobacteria bacterium]|tara:strand:- start:956 stop:1669 length:714 start_codon:yes stop_codon:yes gene_type:complete
MNTKLTSIFLGLCLSLIVSSACWSQPQNFVAVYTAQLKQADGQLSMTLKKEDGGLYSYELTTKPGGFWRIIIDGSIWQKSTFILEGNDVLRSQTYELIDTIRSKPRKSRASFDWEDSLITGHYKDRAIKLPLTGNIIDKVSLQIAIIMDIRRGIDQSEYYILDKDKIQVVQVNRNSSAMINVPFGKFEAIEINRSSPDSNRTNTLWLAPELDYIPVKITQEENGKIVFSASLSQLTH